MPHMTILSAGNSIALQTDLSCSASLLLNIAATPTAISLVPFAQCCLSALCCLKVTSHKPVSQKHNMYFRCSRSLVLFKLQVALLFALLLLSYLISHENQIDRT
ncbi:hypothetical protein K435DRAFT_89926 [Dendrothele bispora CBS 962.96]|uniref:Uncharacterized protein n=1 Tax=Dendrothele bispora (strain CBS 962.96) TaxID=1314807 RepID=A0A4S8KPK8_DENBC|nr:hypothetical protein K435DRAFT_89926 [Dendrothele bispora CBS 962.96]